MFTLAEASLWSTDEALQNLTSVTPHGWKLRLREESGYLIAELLDADGASQWASSNADPKFLYLEGLGWLMVRDHKPSNPMWKPRARDISIRVPIPVSRDPDPPDLDPVEVEAVYRTKR